MWKTNKRDWFAITVGINVISADGIIGSYSFFVRKASTRLSMSSFIDQTLLSTNVRFYPGMCQKILTSIFIKRN